MTDLRTAAAKALEALEQSETFVPYEGFGMARREAERKHQAAITALKEALVEPVQEPVAWQWLDTAHFRKKIPADATPAHWRPLYTAPPQRKPLTEEEIDSIWDSEKAFADIYAIARAIERAHGIGGNA